MQGSWKWQEVTRRGGVILGTSYFWFGSGPVQSPQTSVNPPTSSFVVCRGSCGGDECNSLRVPKRHRSTQASQGQGTQKDQHCGRSGQISSAPSGGMFWRIRSGQELDDLTAGASVNQRALSGERRHGDSFWTSYPRRLYFRADNMRPTSLIARRDDEGSRCTNHRPILGRSCGLRRSLLPAPRCTEDGISRGLGALGSELSCSPYETEGQKRSTSTISAPREQAYALDALNRPLSAN